MCVYVCVCLVCEICGPMKGYVFVCMSGKVVIVRNKGVAFPFSLTTTVLSFNRFFKILRQYSYMPRESKLCSILYGASR